jgi:hypothetical protein
MTDTIERPLGNSHQAPAGPPRQEPPSLAWFAGARRDVLASCPSETRFYHALGLAVLLTGCLSGVTLAIALGYVFREPAVRLWPVSVAWSAFIVNLDRLLVMMPASRKFLLAVLGRLLISLFVGIQIAEPLVLATFQPEIRARLQMNTQAALQRGEQGVADFYQRQISRIEEQIDSLHARENGLVAKIDHDRFIAACEAAEQNCSLTHELGCGPVCRYYTQLAAAAQNELNAIKPTDDAEIAADVDQLSRLRADEEHQQSEAASAAAQDTGLIAREDALSQIERGHPGVSAEVWFIRISLILLDLMPLILKIVHVLDGSAYESVAGAWKRRDALAEHEIDLGTGVEKERLEDQARADRDVNRITIQADRDRRIANAAAGWTATPSDVHGGPDHGGPDTVSAPRQEPVRTFSLDQYVQSMKGQGRHESMAVPIPRVLAIAGWTGTALTAALAGGLEAFTIATARMLNGAWLVWLSAVVTLSLAVYTRGFRRAPGWALRATFIVLLVGLGLPFVVAAFNL